jgi:hypothetical protein
MYATAYGVQYCKRELGVKGWSCSVFVVVCSCWFRVYWVQVPHNMRCVLWSGWKCRGGVGHAVYGYCNGCVCLLWVWEGVCHMGGLD